MKTFLEIARKYRIGENKYSAIHKHNKQWCVSMELAVAIQRKHIHEMMCAFGIEKG